MSAGKPLFPESKNRWLLASFVVTALLLLLLLGNLFYTQQTLTHLGETQLGLEQAAGDLPFHVQGMQSSVLVAAESGDLTWREQHQEHRQGAESTLARIEKIASSPAVAEALGRLRTQLEETDSFHQGAFEQLVQGEKETAKSILRGWPYIRNRNALQEESEELSRLLRGGVRDRLVQHRRLATGTVGAVLLISLVMLLSWVFSLRSWNLNVRQRREKEAEILYLSYHDELTGLPNRRRFIEAGEMETARARRYGRPLAVLILDIDHFKWINDTFGHLAGDQVLIDFSEVLAPELRDTDLLARLGGEEFAVLLPETSLHTAFQVAERLREKVFELGTDYGGQMISVTVSIGATSTELGKAALDTLLGAADDALYEAKESGRDCVRSKAVDSLAPVRVDAVDRV
ncbi:MAG: GGDEF domain-containing protein [Halorhodospira sp.]